MAWQAARQCENRGIPWAIEVVNVLWDGLWNYGSLAAKAYAPFAEWCSRYWIHRAPFALYVTEGTLQERYPCPGHTAGISNVMIPDPDEKVLERRLNRIHGDPSPGLTFGFVGAIGNERKGLRQGILALAASKSDLPPFHFRIIGPGDPSPWKKLAREVGLDNKIHFDGVLPSGTPVLEWLDKIDVYLHPSLQDGLPRGLIEAMSRGCPSLASRAGGIPELLSSSEMHEPGNWRVLADHILELATDERWQIKSAKRNFERSKKYVKSKLKNKRSKFWGNFRSYVEKRK
jgi:glycosyltransferase involved in cell wall biosynthesis